MITDFSGTYYIRELFDISSPRGSVDGYSEFLDWDNCKVINKKLDKDQVALNLERESDGMLGSSSVRVKPKFKEMPGLLNKLFINTEIMKHTLNQIKDIKISI